MQISGNTDAAHAFLRDLERLMREHGVDDDGFYPYRDQYEVCVDGHDWYVFSCTFNADDIRDYLSQQQREDDHAGH